jgi:hypothetical protein
VVSLNLQDYQRHLLYLLYLLDRLSLLSLIFLVIALFKLRLYLHLLLSHPQVITSHLMESSHHLPQWAPTMLHLALQQPIVVRGFISLQRINNIRAAARMHRVGAWLVSLLDQ